MATKSSLSIAVLIATSLGLFGIGCSTSNEKGNYRYGGMALPKPTPAPTKSSGGANTPVDTGSKSSTAPIGSSGSLAIPDAPRIGVIIGPGGTRTLAALGALRELEKAQVQIEAIVGLEWGAIVAGLWAAQGRSNDAEWQLSKFKANDLPQEGLLRKDLSPASPEGIRSSLKAALGDKKVSELRVKFLCPAHAVGPESISWQPSSLVRDALIGCASYPPILEAKGGYHAAPFEIASAAEQLRKIGVNKVLLINVLAPGQLFKDQKFSDGETLEILWREVRNNVRTDRTGIDLAIDLPTREFKFSDVGSLRNLITVGQKSAAPMIPAIQRNFGLN